MNADKPILFNLCSSVFIRGHDAFGVFQQAFQPANPNPQPGRPPARLLV
jgi:hypothetical protein